MVGFSDVASCPPPALLSQLERWFGGHCNGVSKLFFRQALTCGETTREGVGAEKSVVGDGGWGEVTHSRFHPLEQAITEWTV